MNENESFHGCKILSYLQSYVIEWLDLSETIKQVYHGKLVTFELIKRSSSQKAAEPIPKQNTQLWQLQITTKYLKTKPV